MLPKSVHTQFLFWCDTKISYDGEEDGEDVTKYKILMIVEEEEEGVVEEEEEENGTYAQSRQRERGDEREKKDIQ